MSRQELVTKLREVRFLQEVEDDHLAEIADLSTLVSFEEGEEIFREGEPAEHVYFCVSGAISLEMCAPGSGCKRVLTLGPGEMIGWSAILDHSWLTATARATVRPCSSKRTPGNWGLCAVTTPISDKN